MRSAAAKKRDPAKDRPVLPLTPKGLPVNCLRCGREGCVMVSLADTDELYCSNCAEEYGLSEVRQHVDRWVKTLAWLDAAPRAEEDSE